jgi:hypothetical protein
MYCPNNGRAYTSNPEEFTIFGIVIATRTVNRDEFGNRIEGNPCDGVPNNGLQ